MKASQKLKKYKEGESKGTWIIKGSGRWFVG
jgi:hypothetical protein